MAIVIEWAGFHINAKMITGTNWSNIGRNSYEGRLYISGWPAPGFLTRDFTKQEDAVAAVAEVVRSMRNSDDETRPSEPAAAPQ
jgi:hypothetical protein